MDRSPAPCGRVFLFQDHLPIPAALCPRQSGGPQAAAPDLLFLDSCESAVAKQALENTRKPAHNVRGEPFLFALKAALRASENRIE
jgi:hypothetical protein